jgi:hypothetical protein
MIDKDSLFKPSVSQKVYEPTDKLPGLEARESEGLYWTLAGWIGERLGPGGGTPAEIYHEVLGPKGLTQQDTTQLLYNAKKLGYLK